MKIVCIGWGSLIWNSGDLRIKGDWYYDGPFLPVEYARTSKDGRLTLVIVEGMNAVQTLWIEMDCTSLEEAVESLRLREGTAANNIGILRSGDDPIDEIRGRIKRWIVTKDIDAVIWTNLPPKFGEQNHRIPTEDEAINHIVSLTGWQMQNAREYIINTPRQIETLYRSAFRQRLGIAE